MLDQYALLTSGASIGDNYGPLVISPKPMTIDELRRVKLAVPGTSTTAYLALRLCAGDVNTVVIPFDQIMDAVARGEADAGLLIHEGQLTYAARGFNKVVDLGEWWKAETGLPLPLGGNAIKKSLGPGLIQKVSRLLRESIEFGLGHRTDAVRHSMAYGRGMEVDLTDKFVGMYVNDYTIDYGDRGREAVRCYSNAATKQVSSPARWSWSSFEVAVSGIRESREYHESIRDTFRGLDLVKGPESVKHLR